MIQNKKAFEKQPINKWAITDSDGTVAPFVRLEDLHLAKPTQEFIEKLRQFSFNNPDTGIMILSGRKNGELNAFYRDVMKPDDQERTPKFILGSENGAFMQFKPINDTDALIIPETHERVHQMAEPLAEELIEGIENLMRNAAGDHYTNDNKDTSPNKWIKAEVKKYGFTVHYKEPKNEADIAPFNAIVAAIKAALKDFGAEKNLAVHLDAASALTIERVSKGITMEMVATNAPDFEAVCKKNGLITEKPLFMTYSGDDAGDRPALNVLNERFAQGTLKGYTARPNNFTPYDSEGRTPNGPKELFVADSFYILGSTDTLAQDQHRAIFVDSKALENLNSLRTSLSDLNLLPSQNTATSVPPIVLLTSGAILIQQPELYPEARLDNLKSWTNSEVVLLANEEGTTKSKLEELAQENRNLQVVNSEGQLFKAGAYATLGDGLAAELKNNKIVSKDPVRATDVQFLRAIQTLVAQKELTQTQSTGLSAFAALGKTPSANTRSKRPATDKLEALTPKKSRNMR